MTRSTVRLVALLLIFLCGSACFCASAQYDRGTKSFGPKAGFVSRNTSAVAGITFDYTFSRHFRLAPEVAVIFRHKDLDGLSVDVNAQFPFPFQGGRAAFYPLAGLDYTSWGVHSFDELKNKDVTNHRNGLGVNVGAGLEFYCTSSLKLSVEGRYTFLRHYPTAFATVGIAYVF